MIVSGSAELVVLREFLTRRAVSAGISTGRVPGLSAEVASLGEEGKVLLLGAA